MKHWTLLWLALEMAVRHPVRFWATVGCLVAVFTPLLVGMAILEGVRAESIASVDEGPDLLVTGYEYGRNGSVAEALVERCRRLPDVSRARGRIVGRTFLSDRLLTVVGLGRSDGLPVPPEGEAWVGAALAADLKIVAGSYLSLADQGELTLRVGRVLSPRAGLASSRLVMLSLKDAQKLYETPGRVFDLQIWVRPGEDRHARRLLQVAYDLRTTGHPLRIQTKKLVGEYVDRGLSIKGGTFQALYLVALGVLVPALLVTSGFGLSTRRWEIGLMKALGFSVVDVIEMAAVETAAMSVLSTCLSFLLAWCWVRLLEGALVAQLFIAGLEQGSVSEIPARFAPEPVLIVLALAAILLSAGLVYTSYRSATARPVEALR
ncbi:MAG: FtsX-like permease family protein [Candidatus Riflebacteria bacterium]|nr:FtsX-like permease family protein [Candidatus Riflebacteria bacterium]